MIHRVIYGSIERFFGILVEHFSGKFPMWLAPVQAVLLPVNQDLIEYAKSVRQIIEDSGIRCEVDQRNETLKKKIRDAQLNYIPIIITIGEKEKQNSTLALRTLDGKVKMGVSMDAFLQKALPHIQNRVLESIVL